LLVVEVKVYLKKMIKMSEQQHRKIIGVWGILSVIVGIIMFNLPKTIEYGLIFHTRIIGVIFFIGGFVSFIYLKIEKPK